MELPRPASAEVNLASSYLPKTHSRDTLKRDMLLLCFPFYFHFSNFSYV